MMKVSKTSRAGSNRNPSCSRSEVKMLAPSAFRTKSYRPVSPVLSNTGRSTPSPAMTAETGTPVYTHPSLRSRLRFRGRRFQLRAVFIDHQIVNREILSPGVHVHSEAFDEQGAHHFPKDPVGADEHLQVPSQRCRIARFEPTRQLLSARRSGKQAPRGPVRSGFEAKIPDR